MNSLTLVLLAGIPLTRDGPSFGTAQCGARFVTMISGLTDGRGSCAKRLEVTTAPYPPPTPERSSI